MSQEPQTPVESCSDTNQAFENQFSILRSCIQSGNFEKAIQSFVLLQSNSLQNPAFQAYIIQVAENLDPAKDTDASRFFASLPCLLQSNIIDFAREHLEEKESMRAFGIDAINLLILCAQALKGDERQKCISLLVTELFPRLCKQRLLLVRKDKVPSIKSTESKHYITLPYNLFEQFLLLGQRFYIKKHKWDESSKFTCAMLSACGMDEDIETGDALPTIDDLSTISTLMCEYMVATSHFVQFGYDYYKYVCGTDDNSSLQEQKSCLIPVCSFQPNNAIQHRTGSKRAQDDTPERNTLNFSDDSHLLRRNDKRKKIDSASSSVTDDEDNRGKGLDSYCVNGVDNALQILSKAADCLRHCVDLWTWANGKLSQKSLLDQLGGWEQELCRVIEGYKLPFDMNNAVLLVRSDLALSSPSIPGNLAKALELSQTICDRIEVQRRQEKTDNGRTKTEMDIPFMFAFRVLYNIGVIYLLVGSLQQSTLEIAIILSVFPIPNGLDEKDFIYDEIDCCTVANIFHGREFGLMRVTQEGLVVRCIKHLIVSLDNESEQRGGMASIDSALRWDEKAGNMIVLMQYGWPYWNNKTNLWYKIMNRISEKRVFKNREFLEYLYVSDVLQAIRHLHLIGTVTMDIIPPEFALRASYRHLVTPTPDNGSAPSSPQHPSSYSPKNDTLDEDDLDKRTERAASNLPMYHPSFANSILPSTSMSPSWYSASTQKNSFAKWMSPSFYYSRPATSVILPAQNVEGGQLDNNSSHDTADSSTAKNTSIPREIVTRCLEYRIRRYSPKITPQRMRHVLQRFLKNMVLKANEET
ncbi:hypothetical protein INT48_001611 [Thamnidium elegans]|uniref:Uncharacterized protein n=1 Tax=Thamnidium elegans TaxID=101142 RepID=A0A8H7SK72_9FUNG|nr:hypothetical protein INT48_001611 [Thamnidium elegans]